ncbi:hypothetical protein [Peribacillus asahii]|uniref:hypothetical protein n=1 Tax=Peribacillus asahii TaxID=228899 RepID=UPI00207A943B|nr:hypothetical protein [Peribacillus asahii]USK72604.1 hypothetical protein LIS76_19745 [Peribacillus asahii]
MGMTFIRVMKAKMEEFSQENVLHGSHEQQNPAKEWAVYGTLIDASILGTF